MKVTRGKVVAGRIVVEGVPLPEGREVAVCFEEEEPSQLTPEARSGLGAAVAQLDRGEGISKEELFSRLASRRR